MCFKKKVKIRLPVFYFYKHIEKNIYCDEIKRAYVIMYASSGVTENQIVIIINATLIAKMTMFQLHPVIVF